MSLQYHAEWIISTVKAGKLKKKKLFSYQKISTLKHSVTGEGKFRGKRENSGGIGEGEPTHRLSCVLFLFFFFSFFVNFSDL